MSIFLVNVLPNPVESNVYHAAEGCVTLLSWSGYEGRGHYFLPYERYWKYSFLRSQVYISKVLKGAPSLSLRFSHLSLRRGADNLVFSKQGLFVLYTGPLVFISWRRLTHQHGITTTFLSLCETNLWCKISSNLVRYFMSSSMDAWLALCKPQVHVFPNFPNVNPNQKFHF